MNRLLVGLPCCLALLLSGCGAPAAGGELAKSSQARDTAPSVGGADSGALAAGNTAFALDLYERLRGEDTNLFFSPYSISVALAMAYAGARGGTERQMAGALHYTLPQDTLHPAFNVLDLELASRGEGARGRRGEPFRLHIANALWGQTGYSFLPDFLDLLARNYGAGMRLVDFRTAPEPSRVTINDWVADQTEDRIRDLIPSGVITTATRLVLTNAI
jgi:serpin B